MSGGTSALVALILYVLALLLAFGFRSWRHRRRTGSSGVNVRSRPGSAPWWGAVLFVLALILAAAAPILALTGHAPAVVSAPIAHWIGLALTLVSSVAVLAAQAGMGASWRIGVDTAERTALVTSGAFAWVRNPIFTGMVATVTGLALMVPNGVAIGAALCLIAAVQIQVRAVEEPYLLTVHGESYRRYAGGVGRFVPLLGRSLPGLRG
jgi:protein-S-isoprenylcysteine O-methyltransferase Ste14